MNLSGIVWLTLPVDVIAVAAAIPIILPSVENRPRDQGADSSSRDGAEPGAIDPARRSANRSARACSIDGALGRIRTGAKGPAGA